MKTRRDLLKGGMGLAGIIAAQKCPAFIKGLVAASNTSLIDGLGDTYVSNGLVAMWDGEWNDGIGLHNPNATIWKDLTGNGYDLPFYKTPGGYACHKVYDKAIGNGYSGYTWGGTSSIPDNVWNSCEVVFRWDGNQGSNKQRIVFVSKNWNMGINLSTYNNDSDLRCVLFPSEYNSKNRAFSMGSPSLVKGNIQSLYIGLQGNPVAYWNGTKQSLGYEPAVGWSKGRDIISIGGENYSGMGRFFQGCIFSIRLYSRSLTNLEIGHNYAIDKERFGL